VSAKVWSVSDSCIFGQFCLRLLRLERSPVIFLLGSFDLVLQGAPMGLQSLTYDDL
jgi:hypothetical protein